MLRCTLYMAFTIGLLGVSTRLWSQDAQFSQFYNQVLLLNPAFTGATTEYRMAMGYRNQWPELPESFVSYTASFDAFFPEINSGAGLYAFYDRAGAGFLSQMRLQGSYSYAFQASQKITIRPALSFGYYRRAVNADDLVFGDQLVRGGGVSSVEQVTRAKGFFDFSSGLLVYSQNLWFGFSALHINTPNEALVNEFANLPRFFSAHMGGRLVLRRGHKRRIERAVWGAVNLRAQDEFTQADVGFYAEFYPMMLGLWYRGIDWRGRHQEQYQNSRDAIVPMVGAKFGGYTLAYSYDITISNLVGNSGGAHELGFSWEFQDQRDPRKRLRIVPCPAF